MRVAAQRGAVGRGDGPGSRHPTFDRRAPPGRGTADLRVGHQVQGAWKHWRWPAVLTTPIGAEGLDLVDGQGRRRTSPGSRALRIACGPARAARMRPKRSGGRAAWVVAHALAGSTRHGAARGTAELGLVPPASQHKPHERAHRLSDPEFPGQTHTWIWREVQWLRRFGADCGSSRRSRRRRATGPGTPSPRPPPRPSTSIAPPPVAGGA